ncbi:hypothetical protein CAPTEDRAFT_127646, partial [Capitella teleta]
MRGIPEAVCKLLRLENLALDNNSIELLKPDCFANLKQLRSLTMNNNRLTEIPNHIFDSNKLLQLVYFNENNINSIGLYVFSNASILKNLESISNRIEYLPGRAYLVNVTILDVSNNLISRLDPLALTLLQEASEIRLHNNRLTRLPPEVVNITEFKGQISLHNNPWNCSCEYIWLQQWMQNLNTSLSIPVFCASPERLS